MAVDSSSHAPSSARRLAARPSAGWLFGPGLDLWIGCGLAYVVTAPLLLGLTRATGAATWSIVWVGLFATFVNAPHYGATLVRVYEQRADRQRYVFFTVWVTLALVVALAAALRSPLLGSALITLYISWSPWHFSGQNYGLAVMFLGRSGVAPDARTKRLLQASFFLAFVLALLAIHVEASGTVYAAGATDLSEAYRVLRLGIPTNVALALLAGVGAAYLGCLVAAFGRLWRTASWRALVPVAVLVLTEALWFVVPGALQLVRDMPVHALPFAAIWISTAHSAQYLWVSAYYAKRSGRHGDTPAFLAKSLLAGSAVIGLPGLLVLPVVPETLTWTAGLAALLFAVVNLHHFLLDGAIWKLRDGPVARVLIRSDKETDTGPELLARPSWIRRAVLGAGAVCLVVPLVQTWELSVGLSRPGDVPRLERAAHRLAWIGRDSPKAWLALGAASEQAGQVDKAIGAYREALAIDADQGDALSRLAWNLAVYRGDDPASAAEAVELAERASVGARHRDPRYLDTLGVALAANGRFDAARATGEQALAIARRRRMPTLAAEIEARVALYAESRPFSGAVRD